MIGQILGHYRIVEKIGAGGMGEVYRAHDEKLERDVALKVLPAGTLADEVARKRFRKEALALAKLNHPNIETIYEFASQDGVDFLAMELIAGITLGEKLNGGPLAGQEILTLGSQIAEGLNAAHEKGIVHCDLKPGNVMVMLDGHVKVLDFGLAKFLHASKDGSATESVTETQAAGTLPYMSPEQVRGERVDFRSDIYGAGAVIYEMSTGQRPFPETRAPQLIDAILHQEPEAPSAINRRVTPGLDGVVLKSLDKHPERRYQSARELAVDLGRLAPPESRIARAHPRRATKVWLVAGAVVLFIAILSVAFPSARHLLARHKAETVARTPSPNFTGGKRLAILPFKVEGDQSSLGYIADGLAESLQSRLFQLSGLIVAPGDAANRVDPAQSPDKVGQALGVNLILRGVVRNTQQGLHIVVNLQNISDAQPFWTQQFSANMSSLLPVQDEIYEGALAALAIQETDEERLRDIKRPVVSESAYALYLKGREKMSQRQAIPDLEGAIHFYREALKLQDDFDLPYIGMAKANLRIYQENKNKLFLQRATNAAQRAVQLNDASLDAHFVLASLYRATSRETNAVEELTKALSIVPNSDQAYWRLGNVYLSKGDMPHAIEAYRKAVDLNPYYWINENSLGDAYYQTGEYDKALQAFKQVTTLEPYVNAGYQNSGNVLVQQGKYSEAVPYLQKALQIQPDDAGYTNLGTAYFFLKQYSNAVEMFEKAVTRNRSDVQLMVNMGDSYSVLGKHDMARATYEQAIYVGKKQLEVNPKNAAVMAEMALAYSKTGNAQESETLIRRARAQDKKDVSIAYVEVLINALNGKQDQALSLLGDALENHFPAEYAASDPDLDNLKKDPRFNDLIQKYSTKPN